MTTNWSEEIKKIHERAVGKRIVPWSDEDVRFLALALAGEVGELANMIKKHWRGDPLPAPAMDPKVKEELVDIRVYVELLAYALHVDLDAGVTAKLPTIREKFKDRL